MWFCWPGFHDAARALLLMAANLAVKRTCSSVSDFLPHTRAHSKGRPRDVQDAQGGESNSRPEFHAQTSTDGSAAPHRARMTTDHIQKVAVERTERHHQNSGGISWVMLQTEQHRHANRSRTARSLEGTSRAPPIPRPPPTHKHTQTHIFSAVLFSQLKP